jgi:hypothetical protein
MTNEDDEPSRLKSMRPRERSTVGVKGYVRLMVDYLRLSPTYELARKSRNGELSSAEKRLLPPDFDLVLKTYDEFGDVSPRTFEDWWRRTGQRLYIGEFDRPVVRKIAEIEQDASYEPAYSRALVNFFKTDRAREGNRPALILAVPLGSNKAHTMRQISNIIDEAGIKVPTRSKGSSRTLAAIRLHSAPLIRGLKLLTAKARDPSLELWRLGLIAQVSPTYDHELDFDDRRSNPDTVDARIQMASLTSRALKKAKYVCENAARGKFPSSDPIKLPVFVYKDIARRNK